MRGWGVGYLEEEYIVLDISYSVCRIISIKGNALQDSVDNKLVRCILKEDIILVKRCKPPMDKGLTPPICAFLRKILLCTTDTTYRSEFLSTYHPLSKQLKG